MKLDSDEEMPFAGEFGAWTVSTRVGKLHLLLPHPQRGGMPKPSGMPHFWSLKESKQTAVCFPLRFFYCVACPNAYKFDFIVDVAMIFVRRFSTGKNAMHSGAFYFYRWYYEIPSGRRRDSDA